MTNDKGYSPVRGSTSGGSEDGSSTGDDVIDKGIEETEQGLEAMDLLTAAAASSSSSFPSFPAAALGRRRDRRRWHRVLAAGLGVISLAGVSAVAFLAGSSSVPSDPKMEGGQFVPGCPGVVTLEDYGSGGVGAKNAAADPITVVYDHHPSIVLYGDSITEQSFDSAQSGWGGMLANTYRRHGDVKNRGFSGYTTRDSVRALDMIFPAQGRSLARALPPALVVAFLGANDAIAPGLWVKPDGEDHHVPIDEYKANLKHIVAHLRALHAEQRIVFVTPPAVDDERQGPDRTNARARQYADAMLAVGAEEKIPTFDLWKATEGDEPAAAREYLVDGLHLSAKGNRAAYDGIIHTISEHFEDMLPGREEMPKQVPDPW